jgi:sulfite exporter TauE/SafE
MLSSINPLGERARGQRFWLTATWYVIGSLIGGAAMGAGAGTVGSFLPAGDWRIWATVGVLLIGMTLELLGKVPPSRHRQVDENWLTRYRGWVYGLGFGLQLGLGVATIVTSASVYTTILVAALSGSPVLGAMIGGAFGLVRSMPIVLVSTAGDPQSLRNVMRRLQARLPVARIVVVATQALLLALVVTS